MWRGTPGFLPLSPGSFRVSGFLGRERNQDSQRKSFQISNRAFCFWLSAGSVTLGRCQSAQLLMSVKNHCPLFPGAGARGMLVGILFRALSWSLAQGAEHLHFFMSLLSPRFRAEIEGQGVQTQPCQPIPALHPRGPQWRLESFPPDGPPPRTLLQEEELN